MSVYDDLNFAPMFITEVFASMKASTAWYDKTELSIAGEATYPFVSRTKASNGVEGFCSKQEKTPEPGNAIIIGLDTQTIAYQPVPFYTSQNIQVLRHPRLSQATALVLAACIREQMGKFSWGGNGATLGRLKKLRIMIPVTMGDDGEKVVDWDSMTRFGEELMACAITHIPSARTDSAVDADAELSDLRFEPLFITDVFETYRQAPAWLNTTQVEPGSPMFPHVTNTAAGNSVAGFIACQSVYPNPGNAITVGIDTQVVAYQPVAFYGATKVYELRSSRLNADNGLVMVSLLRRAIEKFSWGHKASAERLRKTRIMVPITEDEFGAQVVDWDGMTQYGRGVRARAEREMSGAVGSD